MDIRTKTGKIDNHKFDVLITAGSFMSAVFIGLASIFTTDTICENTVCKLYGSTLNLTTIMWFMLTTLAIYHRIRNKCHPLISKFIIMAQYGCLITTFTTLNFVMWYRSWNVLNDPLGAVVAIFTTAGTFIIFVLIILDLFWRCNNKIKKRKLKKQTKKKQKNIPELKGSNESKGSNELKGYNESNSIVPDQLIRLSSDLNSSKESRLSNSGTYLLDNEIKFGQGDKKLSQIEINLPKNKIYKLSKEKASSYPLLPV